MRKRPTDSDSNVEGGIAIVGMACRAPGVHGVDEYWNLLVEGVDAICDVPANRFRVDETDDPRMRRGGFVDNVAGFDAEFFSISPREAESMDPQQRLLLECVWEAFEDAGHPRQKWQGTNTGVFVGTDTSNYWERRHRSDPNVYGVMGGGARSSMAGRVSYVFDLNGPALSIDSACASSLSAVHLASRSLRDGECTAAIAAGVHLILGPWESRAFSDAGMLSPDNRCKFGDADADGFVRSEGIGVLLLRPLADALADGDPIHAVIAGSGSSNDGSGSDLFMAPARSGQRLMLERAYADARIDPRTVAFVEAHGTGTQAGDPVELGALHDVLGRDRSKSNPLYVGSVKTNIGHAEAAAGILGTIKAVLASKHRVIPANLNFVQPNPEIDWDAMSIRIPTEATPLGDHEVVGVNAFGVSGTNVHVVLAPAPAPNPTPRTDASRIESGNAHLLTLSAGTEEALRDTIRFHLAYFGAGGSGADVALADICHTAAMRRTHHVARAAVVGETHGEISEALRAILHDPPERLPRIPRRVVFVFPGQGSQWFGMGRDLLATSPAFRSAVLECEQAIFDAAGWSLIDALTDDTQQWDRIDVVQPSLWAMQVALARTWQRFGVDPSIVVGHSMGEVAAACISGALSVADGARIMCLRSSAMSTVSGEGAMLVVGAPATVMEQWITDNNTDVVVAVVNSSTSTVISGPTTHIDDAEKNLDAAGYFVRRVAVDVASHSPQMDPLTRPLAADLADLSPRTTEIDFFSTVVAARIDGAELDADYWASNLRNRVRFEEAISNIAADRPTVFVEISPHPLLSSAIRDNDSATDSVTVSTTTRNQPERAEILQNVAALYAAGIDIDFAALYENGRCVPMPRYAWQRERFWLDDAFDTNSIPTADTPKQTHPIILNAAQSPYLDEHVLLGSPMISGATMIEHARRVAVSILGTDHVTIRDAHFFEPLFTADSALFIDAHMQSENEVRCELIDDRGVRYFECTIDDSVDSAPVTVTPVHGSTVLGSDFYTAAKAGGLDWGPRLRGVQAVHRERGALSANVVRPDVLEDDGSPLHPALIEACLTPLLALLERPGWMVAEHIDRIRILGSATTMTSHITLRDNGVDGTTRADVVVLDERNETMAELTGVNVRTSAPIDSQWRPNEVATEVAGPLAPQATIAPAPSAGSSIVLSGDLDIVEPTSGLRIRLSGRIEVNPVGTADTRLPAPTPAGTATAPSPPSAPQLAAPRSAEPARSPGPPAAPAASSVPAAKTSAAQQNSAETATDVDVLDLLMTTVASTLRKPKAKLSADSRARDIGLDSIMSLEVKTRLQSDLTVDIPAKLLLQAASLRDAADTIAALRDSRELRQ